MSISLIFELQKGKNGENQLGLSSIFNIKFSKNEKKIVSQYIASLEGITDQLQREDITTQFLKEHQDELNASTFNSIKANKGAEKGLGELTTQTKLATIATNLLNAAINAVVVILASVAIKQIAKMWDDAFTSVEEATTKVEELTNSINTLRNEFDKLSQKDDLTPEETKRLQYLQQRIELEERLYEIEERKRHKALLHQEKLIDAGAFGSVFKKDKDSYEYKLSVENDPDQLNHLGEKSTIQYIQKAQGIINNHKRGKKEIPANLSLMMKIMEEFGLYNDDSEENFEKATETYDSLFEKYENLIIDADNIRAELESPYITETQRKQYEVYLEQYETLIKDTKDTINKLAIEFNNPEWVITPSIDIDFSKTIPEIKEKMEELINAFANENGIDYYTARSILGLGLEPANRKYNAYADAARTAAEKFGDYTEGYSEGNWQKTYDFGWADKFAKQHKITTDEEVALFKQAVEESESKEDVLDKYIELRKQALSNFSGRLSEEQNKEFDEYEETLNKLHEYLQKAHLGELTDADLQELAKDFKDFSISAENYEGQIREIIDTMSGEMPEKLGLVLDESDKVYQRYADVVKEMKEVGVATTDTVFGNIDTNNRQVIEWTEETIEQYRDALESWGESHPEGLLGSISTVYGATQNVHGVEIAVSPMLQTDNGAVLLDADTVSDYLESIYAQANGDVELMMKLDKKGVNGIKGLIADIGDTAEETSKKMHYTGALGEYMDAYKACVDEAKKLGITTEKFLDQRSEKSALLKALENITREAEIATKALNDAFSAVKSSSDALKDFEKARKEGTIDESILSTIGGLNDELNTLVAGYYGGVVTIDQLYEKLQEVRAKDFEEYKQAYVTKMKFDENYYKNVVEGHREMFKAMSKMYHTDLENATSFESAKLQLKVQLLGKYSEVLASFYDAEGELIQTKYNALYADAMGANGQMSYEALKMLDMIDRYNKAVEELKKIGWSDFDNIDMGAFDKINADLKNTKSEYEELFDFFERRIEVIDQALNKLDASLENVNGSMSKNILIAGKIGIVSEEIKDYSSALIMYEDQANKELAKLDSDLQDKIKNGAVDITKLIGEGGEEVNKILTEYQNWANKVNDCNQKLLELKETLRDLALDKFNNIVQDFTDEFELIGSASSFIDKQISLFEEAGQIIGKGFYEAQIEVSRKQRNLLEKEKAELINELSSSIANGYIQKGTDEWLEMVNSIKEVDESILDCDQSIEQLQNSILELSDQAFERLQNQFSSLKDQLNNINSLIDEIDVSDEEGVWSKEGMTRLGMFAEQYELARHNVEKYQEQIDQLNDSYANGLYSTTEYLDKLSELTEQQWSEALAAEDAKKSIMDLNKARVDLIKEGIQKQIDKYKELIDAQKEALDQDKDLHDWQKTLAEKNKNITKLQNQIAVLSNDDSASANAKRIKLQQELNEALEDLEETQYDHSIEKQKEALDQQMEDFEDERQKEIDALEEYLKDTEKVQKDSFEVIKNNTNAIAETIAELVKTHGVIVSETITNSWKQGENAIAAYGETLAVGTSGFMAEVNEIELYLAGLVEDADTTAEGIANIFNQKADNLVAELNSTRDTELDLLNATNMLQNALIKTLEGGYDNSRIINSLREVQEELDRTRQKANDTLGGDNDTSGGDNTGGKKPTTPDDNYEQWRQELRAKTAVQNVINAGNKVVDVIANAIGSTGAAQGQEKTNQNVIDAQNARRAEEQAAALKTQAQNRQKEQELLKTHTGYNEYGKEIQTYEAREIRSIPFTENEYWNPETGQYSAAYEQLARGTQYSQEAAKRKKEIDDAIEKYKMQKIAIIQKYSGYAVGVHKLKADEMAWTQELGQEAILSPTRNAILTKLNKGDTVLTAEQTDNLFKLSKIDPSTIFGKLKMPTYNSKTMTPVLTIGNVLTVNGNIDDTNVDKMKGFVNNAITKAFKDFSSEIIKR